MTLRSRRSSTLLALCTMVSVSLFVSIAESAKQRKQREALHHLAVGGRRVYKLSANVSRIYHDVLDLERRNFARVGREHHKVSQFARRDGAFDLIFEGGVSAVQ